MAIWLVCSQRESSNGFNVIVYEQYEALGGTWWYTDETGKNKYGLDIHTAMHKNVRYLIKKYGFDWNTLKIPNR